ncbi:unnamed protein product [Urochloa humidicola]
MICSAACLGGPARRGTERPLHHDSPSPASDVIQLGIRGRSSKRQETQPGQRSVRVRALVKSRASVWGSRSSAMSAADAGEFAWLGLSHQTVAVAMSVPDMMNDYTE